MSNAEQHRPRALVVGLGISGISTAISLHRAGWTPVLVEKAPARRRGGYFIGLFGTGLPPAERLGIKEHLHNRIQLPSANFDIDRAGRRTKGVGFADLPALPWLMMRGDVEAAAFSTLEELDEPVEIRYSTGPTAIVQDDQGVDVTLRDSAQDTSITERFDLVVGADGLRSTVRRLVFGPDEEHLRRLNYMIAAFELSGELPGLARGEGATLAEPGRSFWVFPFADHPSTALFSYRTDDVDAEFTSSPVERIRQVYGPEPLGPVMESALTVLDSSSDYLFDSVEQVHLDRWHRGRVVLVGDSAWCVTLYAGMGVSSGIAGADLLGSVLARRPGNIDAALGQWEAAMRPFVEYYQKIGVTNRAFFTPADRAETRRRSVVMRLRRSRLGRRILGRFAGNDEDMRMRTTDIATTTDLTPALSVA